MVLETQLRWRSGFRTGRKIKKGDPSHLLVPEKTRGEFRYRGSKQVPCPFVLPCLATAKNRLARRGSDTGPRGSGTGDDEGVLSGHDTFRGTDED